MPVINGDPSATVVVRAYNSTTGWPVRGVPTTTPVRWDGPAATPPPIDATHAYDGTDTLDCWYVRVTS